MKELEKSMINWEQIEKDFADRFLLNQPFSIVNWFKERVEKELSNSPTIEEKEEYENINVTAQVKPKYGKA